MAREVFSLPEYPKYILILITKVIQDAWRLLSLQTYNHLLNLDISFHLGGTKASLFSLHKAKKGIETNLRFTMNMIIPSLIEAIIGCALLFHHAGAPFMAIFLASLVAFVGFTKNAAKVY
jgi:ABC-type transport system involved in Fe-S cluster assembly fused permease/ATPase subunit